MDGLKRSLLAASFLGLLMTSCSAGSPLENLPPSMGGLPADAPAAPKLPYQFPAVHDMPPPRNDKTLSDDQQLNLLNQLEDARDRQVRRADEERAADGETPKAPNVTKKKPSAAKKQPKPAAQAGVKANP
jgi:hypothetical protein